MSATDYSPSFGTVPAGTSAHLANSIVDGVSAQHEIPNDVATDSRLLTLDTPKETQATDSNSITGDDALTSRLSPIAIVGLACRTSGDVSTPDDLWELCSRARSGWSTFPKDRFNAEAYYHPNPSKIGCFNPQGGYFLNQDLAHFDAPFFNITEQEAKSLDPQQRIILECTFEALESSGIAKESLIGRNVGVFVGGSFSEWELNNCRDMDTTPMYQATGGHQCMLSNRISYFFDFRGPSFTMDTACSSSLVALHQAVHSIRSGESSVAIVASCHINLLPDYFIEMSNSQLLNGTGKSFPFDHRAIGGFGRGEGAGVIILKSVEEAQKADDAIRAVVINSGLNQDGRTNGITAPNEDAQRDLIRETYAKAGADPAECAFAETHGTGTKVGDPIEARAVRDVLAVARQPKQPLYIGSVKSNIGHLEGSSGLLSIIKAAMMLEKNFILPNADYEQVNPNIPLAEWNMKVPTSIRPWPRGKRYISVSNYGFGGANAHIILGKAPLADRATIGSEAGDVSYIKDQRFRLYVLSAADKDTLKTRMNNFSVFLEQRPEVFELALGRNMAYTLGQRRSHLPWKVAIPSDSSDTLGVRIASGKVAPVRSVGEPKIALIFTGQGAQWAQMGAQLIDDYPIFATAMEAADRTLSSLGAGFSLIEELQKDQANTLVNLAHISQPACTAIQVALTLLLNSWGIFPTSVTGHSSGSIAAAFAAGIINAESAVTLAYERGKATLELKKQYPEIKGSMMAVGSGPEEIRPLIKMLKSGYATVACVNSPKSITVSGDETAIDELQPLIEAKGIFNRKLRVDQAYHSEHMSRVAEKYLESIKHIHPCKNSTAVYHSSLLGRIAEPVELEPSYWVANLTSPVQFTDAIRSVCSTDSSGQLSINTLVEVGPHPALEGPVKDTMKTLGDQVKKLSYVGCPLYRNKDPAEMALQLAGALYMKGCKLDFHAVNFPQDGARKPDLLTDLPKYPWLHTKQYWHTSRIAETHRTKRFQRNDIIGRLADYSNDLEPTWRNIVTLDDMPWLRHHKMQAMNVYPMAGYVCQAIEAASQRAQMRNVQFDRFEIREVVTSRALIIEEGAEIETTITLRPYTEGTRVYSSAWDEFRICSWDSKKGWVEHCRGLVAVRDGNSSNSVDGDRQVESARYHTRRKINEITETSKDTVSKIEMYKALADIGAEFGPTFQCLDNGIGSDTGSSADLARADIKSILPHAYETNTIIHPSMLDCFMQTLWPIFGIGRQGLDLLYMPSSVKHISILRSLPNQVKTYCMGNPDNSSPKPTTFNLFATASPESHDVLISYDDLMMTPIREAQDSTENIRELCYKLIWEPVSHPEDAETSEVKQEEAVNGTQINGVNHVNGEADVQDVAQDHVPEKPNGVLTNGVLEGVNGDVSKVHLVNGNVKGSQKDGETLMNGHAYGYSEPKSTLNGDSLPNGHKTPHTNGEKENGVNGNHETSDIEQVEKSIQVNGEINGITEENKRANTGKLSIETPVSIVCIDGRYSTLAEELQGRIAGIASKEVSIVDLHSAEPSGKLTILLELDQSILANSTSENFKQLQTILTTSESVLWVVSGAYSNCTHPESNMAIGLSRTIRSETLAKIVTLDLDSRSNDPQEDTTATIMSVLEESWSADTPQTPETEFMERNGKLLVPRVVPDEDMNSYIHRETQDAAPYLQPFSQPGRRLRLEIGTPGALDTLHFVDDEPRPLKNDEVEIEVTATGMNFKDVVIAMGQVASPDLGVECSGVITSIGKAVTDVQVGQRVMAQSEGAYRTFARCKSSSVHVIPDNMTFESAATIPVVFGTAYYGLVNLAHLEAGETVLIHAAAGGVGQAAILLSKMLGAEIFATVGSAEKKQFLVETYHIPEDRIFYSRDTSFGPAIRRATNGEGVDVVLNSLAGDILRETWDCLAHFGRFIEIGKRDITGNTRLEMAKFEHNATFASVDLGAVALERPKIMRKVLGSVCKLLNDGSIWPITPVTSYPISEVEKALRILQGGKSMGKLVITSQPDDMVKATPLKTSKLFVPDATYLIVGGTGGLGRSMSKWMALKGAKNIVLLSRSGTITDKVKALIDDLKEEGTKVEVCSCDVADRSSVENLVKDRLKAMPPIRGVIQGAMVLRDVLFEQMTHEEYLDVINSKVAGTWNLHHVLADTSLDFFVALSSVAGTVGNRGQAAYAAANVFLNGFVQYRKSQNLPASSIDLTAVADVGYLADNAERQKEVMQNIGGEAVYEKEVLALLAAAVSGQAKQSCNDHCITGLKIDPNRLESIFWAIDPKFKQLHDAAAQELAGQAGDDPSSVPLPQRLKTADTVEAALQMLQDGLIAKISSVLMIPIEDMDPSQPVTTYGLDSLVAIEIRNWITREAEANLQVLELLTSASLTALARTIMSKSKLVSAAPATSDATT